MTSLRATWLRRAPIILPLLLSTACASIPNLGAKPEMRSASEFAASASLTPSGTAWPDQGWWLRYGDAQLNQLIEEGLAGVGSALFARVVSEPPIVGAALLGLDELGAGLEAQARVRRELTEMRSVVDV